MSRPFASFKVQRSWGYEIPENGKAGDIMPIGGFVVTVDSKVAGTAFQAIEEKKGVEIYGRDDKGNAVVVIESETSDLMEDTVRELMRIEGVLSVGLTYLHAEDEVERIESGEFIPKIPSGKRKD